MKNKKVLIVTAGKDTSCSFYRSGGISKSLRNVSGYDIQVKGWLEVQANGLGWQSIYDYDIVGMQGAYAKEMLILAKHVKDLGIPLWLDYDDELLAVPAENKAWPVFINPKVRETIREFYRIADVISVTTENLKSKLSEYNDNIWVIPNAFNDSIFDINRKLPKRRKIVFWRGSDTHIYDLTEKAAEINQLVEEHTDWTFTYMGYNPWFLKEHPNNAFLPALDIIDFFHSGTKLAPSIMQVPLRDTSFNRSKSNIAFIEGTYWGAVSVIPDFWGHIPGTFSYTDGESYYEAVNEAMSDSTDIKGMNEKAWGYIKKNLLLSEVNILRFNLMNGLLLDESVDYKL